MAMRARNLKPGFFLNEDLAKCDPLARLLFAGLWCLADCEGRLEDRPPRIKAYILGYDHCDPDALLQQLHDSGFISRYEVAGRRYIQVKNFRAHQKPHPREAPSACPSPDATSVGRGRRKKVAYFIQAGDGGPVKIGTAEDPQSRMDILQTGNPHKLRLLGVISAPKMTESLLHKMFAALRIDGGEWFRPESELLEFVAANCDKANAKARRGRNKANLGVAQADPVSDKVGSYSYSSSSLNPSSLNPPSGPTPAAPVPAAPAGELGTLWAFHCTRKIRGVVADRAEDKTPEFAEMLRRGADFEALKAAIVDPNRDRNEHLWQFRQRILPPATGPPAAKPARELNVKALIEANQRARHAPDP